MAKTTSSLQKTYDECYLTCSTAVYFEGKNNEAEALRSWRSALETINYHNAYRLSATYTPRTETEKALQDSIRQLETQCRERVDLLEALRESRKEAQKDNNPATNDNGTGNGNGNSKPTSPTGLSSLKGKFSSKSPTSPTNTTSNHNRTPGWIGDGTIPAVHYADLSKPPALPGRPQPQTRISSESIAPRHATTTSSAVSPPSRVLSDSSSRPKTKPKPPSQSRTSSPERKAPDNIPPMLSTLRNKNPKKDPKKDPKKQAKKKASSPRASPERDSRPAASQAAAGLAWDSNYRSPSSSDRGASDAALVSSRISVSDSRYSSGEELPTRRTFADDTEPSTWRTSDQAIRRAPAKTPVTISSAGSGSAHPHSASRERSYSSGSVPRSSPKPSVKPKPAELRTSQQAPARPKLNGAASGSGTPKFSRTSHPVSRTRITPTSTGNKDAGLSGSMDRMGISDPAIRRKPQARRETPPSSDAESPGPRSTDAEEDNEEDDGDEYEDEDDAIMDIMSKLPKGVDTMAARQILNDIVVRGDEVHWDDIAGLEGAKKALKEAVVYPFLRPDLFSGLREPARGMLLFGPPGTGKTMLARAVATESKSTFFSVSASTLTSKWHGESEKLVRALFGLAKALAPSIIFVDEIDSLLSARSSGAENEASRRSKTEFLIQWSDLQRAAAGREQGKADKKIGDASRVLVLAATNMPWDIDEAARRRFVRRQYIPLPEQGVRGQQIRKLLSHQVYELGNDDIEVLVQVTEGFSGSDITALAKDAAMGPLRNLGEALLHTPMDQIRPIRFADFEASLYAIRPSVSQEGLKAYEEWAKNFGERGG
ncbi:putative AAA family ATPase [Aspergillus glaucus CBS 516.65]|uniref:AAA+ ATPase domain-containing protein n=1 Tax=Aspergillus glaucus CBS 516.65 TaxID=1160497 RepID=A0A1L9VFV3_ASPGL|nr:hypothetical protein ASPGLDRAFT_67693 [Aspergillus glaucus CBS 516.65]OJJ82828.1 hypothetical protein ASPGLDRAFT_67693 [Aspergillus glaucus CBS 516.65]